MPSPSPLATIERLRDAINAHDLDALASCFASDLHSLFPAHPDRIFQGHAQMRTNWTRIFGGVPDIHATLVRAAAQDEIIWAEWEWRGTRRDGAPFHQRGVTIHGVRDGLIAWVRLYMEPVEAGSGNDAAVQRAVSGRDDA